MAKVTGGLYSIEASGQFAHSMVFDRRGHVRQYVKPANPKTEQQGNQRQKFLGIQKVIKQLGVTYIDHIKDAAPVGYRWSSWFAQQMSQNFVAATASLAGATTNEAGWTTAANANGFFFTDGVDYATDTLQSAGFLAYLVCYTIFNTLDDPAAVGDPATVAAATWSAAVFS